MSTKDSDHSSYSDDLPRIVVLGAGPAGLSASWKLLKGGIKPVIIERSPFAGGLMRGIQHGDFTVDFGRKEIYNRTPEVTAFWEELLRDDFIEYTHRIGLLYQNHLIDYSPEFRGPLRGIPVSLLGSCLAGFLKARLSSLKAAPPKNYEERWYQSWGKPLSMMASQGFSEKFYGVPWKDRPVEFDLRRHDKHKGSKSVGQHLKALQSQIFGNPDANRTWRHPRRSTQQLVDNAVEEIQKLGGIFHFETAVTSLTKGDNGISEVTVKRGDETQVLKVKELVSTIPMLALADLLGLDKISDPIADRNEGRESFFLYLFLNRPALFPQAWLNVSSPDLALGRVVNYGAFGGDMVPEGKGCVCLELFTRKGEGFADRDNDDIAAQLIEEAEGASLINASDIIDRKIIRIAGAEASNEFQTWQDEKVQGLLRELRTYSNLYDANRAGIDVACFAGICAADAVLTGNRERFDREASPELSPQWASSAANTPQP